MSVTMYYVPVSSEIRHGVDIRHDLNSYSLRMTVCNAYERSYSEYFLDIMVIMVFREEL